MSQIQVKNTSDKVSLLIVGNGMATGRLLDEILKRDPNKYQITVIGEEADGSYNRIMLSSVLAGEASYDDIIQKPHQWYKQNNITFISNALVTSIQPEAKTVSLAIKEATLTTDPIPEKVSYDQLVLAVGSRSAKIPAKNQNLKGIFGFRNMKDTKNIQRYAGDVKTGSVEKNAVVIGGGLLGLEAAYGLAVHGVKVTLIHRNRWLLNRQLDEVAGNMLQKIMETKNIRFVLGQEVVRFDQKETQVSAEVQATLCGAELANGEYLKVDMAVIATGITPNKELAHSANIEENRAIIVDDYMQTSNSNICALGECCEHKNATFGLVDPIWVQCETLAERLCSEQFKAFKNSPVPTKLKVSGVQLFSAGVVESASDTRTYVIKDKKAAIYRKLIVKEGVIVGIVLFGDVGSGMTYFDLMQTKQNISAHLPELLIGHEFSSLTAA